MRWSLSRESGFARSASTDLNFCCWFRLSFCIQASFPSVAKCGALFVLSGCWPAKEIIFPHHVYTETVLLNIVCSYFYWLRCSDGFICAVSNAIYSSVELMWFVLSFFIFNVIESEWTELLDENCCDRHAVTPLFLLTPSPPEEWCWCMLARKDECSPQCQRVCRRPLPAMSSSADAMEPSPWLSQLLELGVQLL